MRGEGEARYCLTTSTHIHPPRNIPQRQKLKQCKLIRGFSCWLNAPPMEGQYSLVLFIGQLQDADLATRWQTLLNAPAVGLHNGLTATESHVDTELAHLEPHVEELVPELGRRLALRLQHYRKIEHHQQPHQPVSRKHFNRRLNAWQRSPVAGCEGVAPTPGAPPDRPEPMTRQVSGYTP